jgi:hypothetical protein
MSIKKSLAITLLIFFASFGLKAAADPVVLNMNSLLTAVNPGNYQSSVAVTSRAEIMKLNADQLRDVIAANPNGIFNTPYGFSLIHGWMVNQLADKRLPFYVNQHYSFDKYVRNLIDVMPGEHAAIHAMWLKTHAEIEANRWDYYKHMQYIPAAIAQAGMIPGALGGVDVIKTAYVQVLDLAGFNAHVESIVGADLKSSEMKTRLESVMLWLLKNFDLDSLLPFNYEINQAQKFVNHVSSKFLGVNNALVFAVADKAANQGGAAIKEGHNVLLTSLVNMAGVYQAGHAGDIATAKNELEQYAVEQLKGDSTQGVPNLAVPNLAAPGA